MQGGLCMDKGTADNAFNYLESEAKKFFAGTGYFLTCDYERDSIELIVQFKTPSGGFDNISYTYSIWYLDAQIKAGDNNYMMNGFNLILFRAGRRGADRFLLKV